MTPMLPDLPLDLAAMKPAHPLASGSAGFAGSGGEPSAGASAGAGDFARLLEATRVHGGAAPPGPGPGPETGADLSAQNLLAGEPDTGPAKARALGVSALCASFVPEAPERAAIASGNRLPLAGERLPDGLADAATEAAPVAAQPAASKRAPAKSIAPEDGEPPVGDSISAAPHHSVEPAPRDNEPADPARADDHSAAGEPVAAAAVNLAPVMPAISPPHRATPRTSAALPAAPIPPAARMAAALPETDRPSDEGALFAPSLRLSRSPLASGEPAAPAAAAVTAAPLSPPPALASPASAAAPALALAPSPALVAEAGAALAGDAPGTAASAMDADAVLDQIAALRDAARSARSDMVLRHGEFGPVTVRIDASGAPGEWRAAIASRDPGFVPAVQAALAERAVAASSEAGGNLSHQHSNSNSNSNNSSAGSGLGQGSGQSPYGSSPGGGQGSSQPYSGQTTAEARRHQGASAGAANATGQTAQPDGDLFA